MLIQIIEVLVLLLLSVISDIKTYKIKNAITYSFAVIGLLTNFYLNGVNGLLISIAGFGVPIVLLFILFALRMLGSGDIKLFSAIGAIMGYRFSLYTIAYSFIFGGIIAVVLLTIRKNAFERFKYFAAYLKSCVLTFKLLDYSDFKVQGGKDKFRFSYAILPGAIMQLAIMLSNV